MKKIIIFTITIIFSSMIYADNNQLNMGYRGLFIGMPTEEAATFIVNNFSSSEWSYAYATEEDIYDKLPVRVGFELKNKNAEETIRIKFTGTCDFTNKVFEGQIAHIFILYNYQTNIDVYQAFNKIKDIISEKYGKPAKITKNSDAEWNVSKTKKIRLNTVINTDDDANFKTLQLDYYDKILFDKVEEYIKKETKRLKKERYKQESEKY